MTRRSSTPPGGPAGCGASRRPARRSPSCFARWWRMSRPQAALARRAPGVLRANTHARVSDLDRHHARDHRRRGGARRSARRRRTQELQGRRAGPRSRGHRGRARPPGRDSTCVEVRRFNSRAQARAAVSDESVDAAVAGGVDPHPRRSAGRARAVCSRARPARYGRGRPCDPRAFRGARRGGCSTRRRCGRTARGRRRRGPTRAWRSPLPCCSTCS